MEKNEIDEKQKKALMLLFIFLMYQLLSAQVIDLNLGVILVLIKSSKHNLTVL